MMNLKNDTNNRAYPPRSLSRIYVSIAAIIIIIISLIISRQIYINNARQINILKSQINDFDKKNNLLSQIKTKYSEVNLLESEIKDIDINTLINKVSLIAKEVGLRVISVKPSKTAQEKYFDILSFSLILKGSYHNTGIFCGRLENLQELLKIDEISIQGHWGQYVKQPDDRNISIAVHCLKLSERI